MADLAHMLNSLVQLGSFHHGQCDAVLQRRGIDIINAYNPHKEGWERDSVYTGFCWIIGWLVLVAVSIPFSWRRGDSTGRSLRVVLPLAFIFGCCMLFIQLESMANYSDVCRRVLRLSSAHALTPADDSGVALIAILTFMAVWFTGLAFKYREATMPLERPTIVLLMIVGGGALTTWAFTFATQLFR